jgi:hypothetical protein
VTRPLRQQVFFAAAALIAFRATDTREESAERVYDSAPLLSDRGS